MEPHLESLQGHSPVPNVASPAHGGLLGRLGWEWGLTELPFKPTGPTLAERKGVG